jgi:hypothetical protein
MIRHVRSYTTGCADRRFNTVLAQLSYVGVRHADRTHPFARQVTIARNVRSLVESSNTEPPLTGRTGPAFGPGSGQLQ